MKGSSEGGERREGRRKRGKKGERKGRRKGKEEETGTEERRKREEREGCYSAEHGLILEGSSIPIRAHLPLIILTLHCVMLTVTTSISVYIPI